MARGFGTTYGSGGGTDSVLSAITSDAALVTYVFRMYRNGQGGGSFGRIFDQGSVRIIADNDINVAGTTLFHQQFDITAGRWYFTTPSGWAAVAMSYDRGAVGNDPVFYVDGASVGVTEDQTPVGTAISAAGSAVYIGDRSGGAREYDGMIAEWARYDRLLTAGEMKAATSGFSPLHFAGLVEYIPMVRDNVSRILAAPTLTGTAVQPHPRVIYPKRRHIWLGTAAGGGPGPTLHNLALLGCGA